MSKRKQARVPAPKAVHYLVMTGDESIYNVVRDPVTPIRNRAEKRALVKQLMSRKAPHGHALDRRAVSGL